MARGSKAKYTDKQKRQAEAIAAGYRRRGVSEKLAKARAKQIIQEVYHAAQ